MENHRGHLAFSTWLGNHTVEDIISALDRARLGQTPEWPDEYLEAALALAYHGRIEDGGFWYYEDQTREEVFDFLRSILTAEQFGWIELVAVPARLRARSARELEAVVRTGPPTDRMHAFAWLALTGWLNSDECSFGTSHDDHLEAASTFLGEVVTSGAEHSAAYRILALASRLYQLNGPPPLAISGPTIGAPRRGWRSVTFLVPEAGAEDGRFTGAIDP